MTLLNDQFVTIPGFSNYLVNREGVVYNQFANRYLRGSFNPDGYLNYRLKRDDGYILTIGRHRVMALAFLPLPNLIDVFIVNHLNGIKGDDRIENLEWVTYRGNQHHAGRLGLTDKCIPVSVLHVRTQQMQFFPSIIDCAKYFGLTKDAVYHRLEHGEHRIYPEGVQYRVGHGTHSWPVDTTDEYGNNNHTLVRLCTTGEIIEFKSQREVALWLDVSEALVCEAIRDTTQPVVTNRLVQIKRANDTTPWRVVTDPWRETDLSGITKHVVCIDTVKGTRTIYPWPIQCATENGISKTCLHYRLHQDRNKVWGDGKQYHYYT